jgi:anhydro-N-acetylmuramic acid kinase
VTERPSLAVGIMSGTSLDGVDAALVRFADPTHATLLGFVSRPYTEPEREQIRAGIRGSDARTMALLHASLAHWAGEAVQELLESTQVLASDLALIAFPGQTVWHEPPLVSWQLGEPSVLAERFGVRVVSNFRARDCAAGGQGAPLVPMADVLLFGGLEPRVLVNIGGMANLTYVARRAQEEGAFAFDTGPGVALIDAVARMVDPSLPFDRDGALHARGRPDERLLAELLADEYFAMEPPKSTGRERFGDAVARRVHEGAPGPDGVATAVELTARTLAAAIARWTPPAEIVVSGGGTHHPGLMASLREHLAAARGAPPRIRRFDELYFDGDAKEAVAFALLGYLTLHGQPGNLPAATGASHPRVLGSITPA